MTGNEELIQQIMERVSTDLGESIKNSITTAVEKEIAQNLSQSLLEGEFYRRINDDLQEGLKQIYQEVKAARGGKERKSH